MRSGALHVALALALALALVGAGCRRSSGEPAEASPPAASSTMASSGSGGAMPKAAGAAAPSSGAVASRLWAHALAAGEDADEEDLAALATHEGAAGLVAVGRTDPARHRLALRAAAGARGYAQVPWLAEVAQQGSDEDAKLALGALAEMGARVRRAEEHEDEEELSAGCAALVALARDVAAARPRRVGAVRAARTLPCAKQELPGDLDAK